MSAQTGVASLPPPPPSVRGVRRLRAHWDRLFTDPNPVWLREMRQAARLPRTDGGGGGSEATPVCALKTALRA